MSLVAGLTSPLGRQRIPVTLAAGSTARAGETVAHPQFCYRQGRRLLKRLACTLGTGRRALVSSVHMLPTIDWNDDGVVMIDQRKLPATEVYVTCRTAQDVAKAIKTMVI